MPRQDLAPEQQHEFDLLLREIKELRPLPAIALRLISMAEDQRFSAQDLGGTIRTDQALTLKVLRLANSPAFGLPRRITSLREAIVLLGFREVRGLALAACVIDGAVRERIEQAMLDYDEFWVNSLVIAHLAQVLAEAEGVDRDEAFTAGIIHNVGRLALAQNRPQWLRTSLLRAREGGLVIHDVQIERYGFSDAELGASVASGWSFPPRLIEAVERHAWPLSELPDRHDLSSIVARARRFARSNGICDGVDLVGRRLSPDGEWSLPKVTGLLRQAGGVEGIVHRARTYLQESAAA